MRSPHSSHSPQLGLTSLPSHKFGFISPSSQAHSSLTPHGLTLSPRRGLVTAPVTGVTTPAWPVTHTTSVSLTLSLHSLKSQSLTFRASDRTHKAKRRGEAGLGFRPFVVIQAKSSIDIHWALNSKPSPPVQEFIATDGTSDSESKPSKCSGKKASSGGSSENKGPVVIAYKKESGTASDSEAKQKSPKNESTGNSNENITSVAVDAPRKDSDSDTEARPKKVDGSNKTSDGSSKKQSEDKKKGTRSKVASRRNSTKSSAVDKDDKEMSTPKLAKKSTKDELPLEETPKKNSKRKRASEEEKQPDGKMLKLVQGSKFGGQMMKYVPHLAWLRLLPIRFSLQQKMVKICCIEVGYVGGPTMVEARVPYHS